MPSPTPIKPRLLSELLSASPSPLAGEGSGGGKETSVLNSLSSHLNSPPQGGRGYAEGDVEITGITADSREVQPGFLFVALRGTKHDGTAHIADAWARGAAAVVVESTTSSPSQGEDRGGGYKEKNIYSEYDVTPIPSFPLKGGRSVLYTANARLTLAQLAAAWYGAQPAHMVAVTGTDGKTSTADFFRQMVALAGKKSAAIGTIGVTGAPEYAKFPAINTTPDPVLLHRILAELKQSGCDYAALEASSHGLDQYRLDGVRLSAAAFTNLSRDHLDYHGTMDAYLDAKKRLFAELLPAGATAVLNVDQRMTFPVLEAVCQRRGHQILRYGAGVVDLRLVARRPTATGQDVTLNILGAVHEVHLNIIGDFQVANILAALGLFIGCGGDAAAGVATLAQLRGVPGRVEQVATHPNGAPIFIDYAHTPHALQTVLNTLRPHTRGHLHVVFGCGGDRDTGKRAEMGNIAQQLADVVIVTDDNPRSEDPASIRAAVMSACPRGVEIAGRDAAIARAVAGLSAEDILVIAGKGHEKTQIIGAEILPFDDAEVARRAVAKL